MQRGVFGDVWRENGAVRAIQMVAGRCCPMRQVLFAIVFVNDAELCDVIDAREDGYTILQSKNTFVLLFSTQIDLWRARLGLGRKPRALTSNFM